jgi:hypothetical protein
MTTQVTVSFSRLSLLHGLVIYNRLTPEATIHLTFQGMKYETLKEKCLFPVAYVCIKRSFLGD